MKDDDDTCFRLGTLDFTTGTILWPILGLVTKKDIEWKPCSSFCLFNKSFDSTIAVNDNKQTVLIHSQENNLNQNLLKRLDYV